MTGNQIQRHLKTEELYQQVIDLYPPEILDVVGETYVRGLLDGILSQGKIEGRMSAYSDLHHHVGAMQHDRLIEQWQCIVDSVSRQPIPERGDRVHFYDGRVEIVEGMDSGGGGVRLCNATTIRASSLTWKGKGFWRFVSGV